MIKERVWPVRLMYLLIAAALAISMIIVAAPAQKVSGAPNGACGDVPAKWERISTPSMDGWLLAPGSIIYDYALADGGDVAYAIIYGQSEDWNGAEYRLLKSTDGAATWKEITRKIKKVLEEELFDDDGYDYLDSLVQVATDWVDPNFVAVALWWCDSDWVVDDYVDTYHLHVFISADGGNKFVDVGEVTAGGIYLEDVADLVVSIAVAGKRDVAIGGLDDSGDVAIFRSTVVGDNPGGWKDATAYEGWDDDDNLMGLGYQSYWLTDLMFSPNYEQDRTILAVTVCPYESGPSGYAYGTVHLQSGVFGKTNGNWNAKAGFSKAVEVKKDVYIPYWLASYDARAIAGVTLPSTYRGDKVAERYAWVWVNYYTEPTGSVGEIRKIIGGTAYSVKTQIGSMPWLTNVSYWGTKTEGKAIAGLLASTQSDPIYEGGIIKPCCEGVQVYRNDEIANMEICCLDWTPACKPPTGKAAMAVAYVRADKAYAVALGISDYQGGDESAWSVSFDDGDTWNQLSLIDTWIDYLSDVAVSPDCNKTFLVSVNLEYGCACDSVWVYAQTFPEAGYEEYSGHWLRTWCRRLLGENDDDFPFDLVERGLLRLAPEELRGAEVKTVYLVDRMSTTIYYNALETLGCWEEKSAATVVQNIVDMAVKDEATIYVLDSDGDVAMSDDHGATLSWRNLMENVEPDQKVSSGWTIAVHSHEETTHILVGGRDGDVAYSHDGGETFAKLEDVDRKGPASDGLVTVAFDSYFDQNNTVYAAVGYACDENGIYRWVIGTSKKWKNLNAKPYNYTGLVLDRPSPSNPMTSPETGGVLYASYVYGWDGYEDGYTGVARCLTPAWDVCCGDIAWDYLYVGLTYYEDEENFCMAPQALKICGCLEPTSNTKIFAIDGPFYNHGDPQGGYEFYDMDEGRQHGTVWRFEDCYSKVAPDPLAPADGSTIGADPCECVNLPFALKWQGLCDACCYEVEFALDEEFTEIVPVWWETLAEGIIPPELYDYIRELGIGVRLVCSRGGNPCDVVYSNTIVRQFVCSTKYYWRVRAFSAEEGQVIRSWWSPAQSFMIGPVGEAISLITPEPGATNIARTKVPFTWSSVPSAAKYDWVLSKNADLSSPVDSKTDLTTTAYTYTGTLDAETPYYWQVTAKDADGAVIATSITGSFTTTVANIYCCPQCGVCFATQQALQQHYADVHGKVITPTWVWVIIAIGAVLVIVVIVLIFRTRRV